MTDEVKIDLTKLALIWSIAKLLAANPSLGKDVIVRVSDDPPEVKTPPKFTRKKDHPTSWRKK